MVFCIAVAGYVLFVHHDGALVADPFLAEYYLAHFVEDTFAENAVAAIYLNYRMYDSIFETLILLVSVTAVINFSWRRDHEE
jgi:multicomponent Na+:H+ antiporter subunit B